MKPTIFTCKTAELCSPEHTPAAAIRLPSAGTSEKSQVLDQALATWAEAYGDQTERDHARLVKAIKSGKVTAIQGV